VRRIGKLLLWTTLAATVLAAAAGAIFVLSYAPVRDVPVRTEIVKGPADRPYSLSFVQFDDSGRFRDPGQLQRAIAAIRGAANTGAVIVVFVHGWNNNCADCAQTVQCFGQLLAFLTELQQRYATPQRPARAVLGIYAGWRGVSARPPWYSRAATFEDRRAAADRLGSYGDLRKLLMEVGRARADIAMRRPSPLLFAGHSLGGRALLRAITTTGNGRASIADIQRFADLYVLLNPAISAADYMLIDEQASRTEWNGEAPRLIALASESDYVTQVAYPFSEDRFWPLHLDDDARRIRFTTLGNHTPFVTHQLTLTSGAPKRIVPAAASEDCKCRLVSPGQLASIVASRRPGSRDVFSFDEFELPDGDGGKPYRVRLVSSGITRGPYMVVRVDRRLMNGHGEIYTPAIVDFLIRVANVRFIKEEMNRMAARRPSSAAM
jgi:hypothetical protein